MSDGIESFITMDEYLAWAQAGHEINEKALAMATAGLVALMSGPEPDWGDVENLTKDEFIAVMARKFAETALRFSNYPAKVLALETRLKRQEG